MKNLLVMLAATGRSKLYWIFLILLGLGMESTALFFQHGLGFGPCVLCIQVRIWVIGIILLGVAGLLLRDTRWPGAAVHLAMTGIFLGLLDRSWLLFGTERGIVFADCGFDLGLPAWLALEDWFPAMFMIHEACGYTPELLLGITMAEALLVMSSLMLLAGLALTIAAFVIKPSD